MSNRQPFNIAIQDEEDFRACCLASNVKKKPRLEKFVGNWQASALRLSEEAVEFATSGVERALLLFRAVVDQRAAVLVDHVAEKSVSRHFP